jgi:UDP-N-acetylglucosamine 3-dehydrogenase
MDIAVIGAGSMGKNHIRICSDLPNVNLVAIADSNEAVVNGLAQKYRTKAYTDYRRLIDAEKLDAVFIVVPTSLHKEVALYAISKGINVFVEKPIAANMAESREIISKAHAKNVKLAVGHIERFNPAIIELKKRISDGELGRIFKIDIDRIGPFPARIRDVGVVVDLAVHDLDILNYLTESKVIRLYSETEKRINTDHEDLLEASLKFACGVIASLNINWLTPTKIRRIHVTGEKGMFMVDYLSQDLFFYENSDSHVSNGFRSPSNVIEGKMTKFYIDKKEPLRIEIEHFIDCCRNDLQPLVTGEAAAEALDLAQKLIESSRLNKVITL